MRVLRIALVSLVLASGGFLVSCGVFEAVTGVRTDPVTGEKSSDGTGGIAGSILNILIPGAAAVVASGAAAYANAKRGQWKNAALSTFEAVEAFKATDQGKRVWADLKGKLGEHQAAVKIQSFVADALEREGINKTA